MLALPLLVCCLAAGALGQATAATLSYVVDFGAATTPFPHSWEECVGSGHAALSLRADWRASLKQAHDELGFKRVRFHGVFDDDMNVALDTGTSFFNIDSTYDFLFSIGMAPFVELSFSPQSMATNNSTIFHYKANNSPPQADKWAALVSDFATHLVERYGAATAESLLFEV
jgi:xylan 1,4-beta-xylosidase